MFFFIILVQVPEYNFTARNDFTMREGIHPLWIFISIYQTIVLSYVCQQ